MVILDFSSVNIALPRLAEIFNASSSAVIWVMAGFTLIQGAITVPVGNLSDRLGRKRVYVAGIVIVTTGIALSSIAQNLPQLLLFRVITGIGPSALFGNSSAIITATFPDKERGKALGIMWGFMGIGGLIGAPLGGLIIDSMGWRPLFYLKIPVGLLGILIATLFLKDPASAGPKSKFRFDFTGAAVLSLGLASLLVAVNQGPEAGWTSIFFISLVSVGIVLLAIFPFLERRTDQPVLDFRLIKGRFFTVGYATIVIRGMSQALMMVLTPFFVIQAMGYAPAAAGLFMIALTGTMMIASPFGGWLADTIGPRPVTVMGFGITAVGFLLMSLLPVGSPTFLTSILLVVNGLGGGMYQPAITSSIMGATPRHLLSTAGGILLTVMNIGLPLGIIVGGAVMATRSAVYEASLALQGLDPSVIKAQAIWGAYTDAMFVGFVFSALGAVLAFAQGAQKKPVELESPA